MYYGVSFCDFIGFLNVQTSVFSVSVNVSCVFFFLLVCFSLFQFLHNIVLCYVISYHIILFFRIPLLLFCFVLFLMRVRKRVDPRWERTGRSSGRGNHNQEIC